jgi:hypothetical protein
VSKVSEAEKYLSGSELFSTWVMPLIIYSLYILGHYQMNMLQLQMVIASFIFQLSSHAISQTLLACRMAKLVSASCLYQGKK